MSVCSLFIYRLRTKPERYRGGGGRRKKSKVITDFQGKAHFQANFQGDFQANFQAIDLQILMIFFLLSFIRSLPRFHSILLCKSNKTGGEGGLINKSRFGQVQGRR